jgi:hypothetical protein
VSLKNKIRADSLKKGRAVAPARAHNEIPKIDGKPVKIPTVIKSLLDSLNADDIDAVARVYREAMLATHRYWSDEGKDPKTGRAKGKWVIEPDHKTRITAANMVAAYSEGLPIQRQVQLNANFKDLSEDLRALKGSPEAMRMLRSLGGLPDVQETGSEKQADVTRET